MADAPKTGSDLVDLYLEFIPTIREVTPRRYRKTAMRSCSIFVLKECKRQEDPDAPDDDFDLAAQWLIEWLTANEPRLLLSILRSV